MLTPIKSELLRGANHGFFTREGGVSSGLYSTLNCGPGSDDSAHNVEENRSRVARYFDLGSSALLSVHQVHSANVVSVSAPFSGARPKCDGMVTKTRDLALAVLSADCAPILFVDEGAGVVGAAHSGWRGTLAGIGGQMVRAMEGLGATRASIKAAIGPTISQRAYEVGPEFVEQFLDADPQYARFFAGGAGDRALFNLPGFIKAHLENEGIQVEWTGECTFSNPERLFSYRRATHANEPDYGRQISAIKL